MPRRRTETGTCHLCGKYGRLSFEHIPPKKAFNNHQVYYVQMSEFFKKQRVQISQRGSGGHTLCNDCNSKTGGWYGGTYIAWCERAMEVLYASRGEPTLSYPYWTYPLRILKQVVTMFFSVNRSDFRKIHPELEKFVLGKDAKHLSSRYRFFAYYNLAGWHRLIGLSCRAKFDPDLISSPTYTYISEISFPPFGFVMTIDSNDPEYPDKRLCEITTFSHFSYDEYRDIFLRLPVLPTNTYFPGDYRSETELTKLKQEVQDEPSLQVKLAEAFDKRSK